MSIHAPLSPHAVPELIQDDTLSSSRSSSAITPTMPSLPLVVPSNSTISVSTAFQFEDADLIILSSDSVFFSVHSRTVRAASAVLSQLIDALSASNSYPTLSDDPASSPTVVGSERTPSDMEALFVAPPTPGSHPPTPQPEKLAQSAQVPKSSAQPLILPLPEPSDVLNVILHFLYHLPCTQFLPTLSTLHAVLNALQAYSIPTYPHSFLSYSLCSLLSPHSAAQPLYTYALAASANLEGLAIFASRFCLHVPLSEITEPMAALMGPLYMRRLLFLHLGRVEALKRTLASPPAMHPPSASDCDVSDQKRITRAWALATAYLAWGARPDMSVVELREVLEPLKTKVDCSACQKSLGERIEQLCIDWCAIKDTI